MSNTIKREELNRYCTMERGPLSGSTNIYAWKFETLAMHGYEELARLQVRLEKENGVHIGLGLNTIQDIIKRVIYLDTENKRLNAKLNKIEGKL